MMLNIKDDVTAKPWVSVRGRLFHTSPGPSPIPAKSRLRGLHFLHRDEYLENTSIRLWFLHSCFFRIIKNLPVNAVWTETENKKARLGRSLKLTNYRGRWTDNSISKVHQLKLLNLKSVKATLNMTHARSFKARDIIHIYAQALVQRSPTDCGASLCAI